MRFLSIFLLIFICFLHAESTEISSISSDFTQTITSAENETLTYKGNFVASKDDSLAFWNYTFPNPKQIYFSKNQILVIEPDLEQIIITDIEQIADISSIINDAIKKQDGGDYVEIEFGNIKYKIFFRDNKPIKISYFDEIENKIEILLSNTKLNENINKSIFDAKLPENYDIVNY